MRLFLLACGLAAAADPAAVLFLHDDSTHRFDEVTAALRGLGADADVNARAAYTSALGHLVGAEGPASEARGGQGPRGSGVAA